jgi:hypothetical protein
MSTVFAIDDVPALGGAVAADDKFFVYDTSSGRTKYATGAEVGGVAPGVVETTATLLTVTAASHSGKVVNLAGTPVTVTLPAATGTGNIYRFAIGITTTATSSVIKVANTFDILRGVVHVMTSATTTNVAAIVAAFKTTATDDTMSMQGTTQGGILGDFIEIIDIKTSIFQINARTQASGAYATPFSAGV